MSVVPLVLVGVASIATMRTAFERGDIDEAARQGMLAGPAVVETALRTRDDRLVQLAAIAAAPATTGRLELLDALAEVAGGPDRRTALPAARAARTIARELARREVDLPDDLAPEDLATWRTPWAELAVRTDRWIELRVLALDTAAALDPGGTGVDLAIALADPDPDYRRAALAVVPAPVPRPLHGVLANTIVRDIDEAVALAAAQVMCFDLPQAPARPILDVLGHVGLQRIRTLVGTTGEPAAVRDAARCLRADGSAASTAALRTIKQRVRR